VVRTDRSLVFYEKQENLSKLWDVLAVYAWVDKDVGYGQGGSYIFGIFWTFCLQHFLHKNFQKIKKVKLVFYKSKLTCA